MRQKLGGWWSLFMFPLCAEQRGEALHAASRNPSPILSLGKDGRLVYDTDERGNRVPDFSHCGYAGGDRTIPDAPVRVVVAPASGDSTARIQKAIDFVARLAPDANSLRGAVLLLKGRHEVFGGLRLDASGVVLRGQGSGKDGTVLVAAGLDRRTLIRIVGRNDRTNHFGKSWRIVDEYVPAGAASFRVNNASGLKPGEAISITRPSTQAWIDRLGMTEFGGGQGDFRLTWKPGSRDLVWDRVITGIDADRVTVDAPITTAIERAIGGGRLEVYSWPGRIRNVGVENVRLESVFDAGNPKDENHSWMAVTIENAEDAWVRQVTAEHFAGSMVAIYESGKRVSVEDCVSLAPISEDGGYRRNTFFTMGQMTLFLRCFAENGRHDFSVGHCAAGPNAFVQCQASRASRDSGPVESWASGALYDNVTIDGNGLTLANRGSSAQGAGWAAANSVLWQCSAARIRCENPPAAQNWAFGCWGEFAGDGIWRKSNEFVSPDSLFAAQVKDRLGEAAAKRLQLMPRPREESSNPPVVKAQQLTAASRHLAPQLVDYIAAAAARNPIPAEPGGAERIEQAINSAPGSSQGDEAPASIPKSNQSLLTSAATQRLVITNGWLTCNGRLLIGGTTEVTWWRGNIRPGEASAFGAGVTRFAPGRMGRGYTDDLEELADTMMAPGQAALDHHYGLWYDRRRDDHERIRRMDGDVWPPFYEQPFARSGQGAAWDGLSRYDLTKFSPWYWSRLKQFADICDQRGLVLFHQNYFQHNVLEAGAHWADSTWRPANNINDTGFPEPPPYAGDKRIFMTEQFYDVTHPVRRELHRRYIRQCLDNFADNVNVIQFTSAEYTGPLEFVQFWLDTIEEWEREKRQEAQIAGAARESARMRVNRKPLVALSCTKDVQDAILADAKRSALVDVVDFRYWWLTSKGPFAPPGGKNLAPRQFERQWRGGRPADTDLAQMAAEYRAKFPGKAIICDFDSGAWAFLCAGGSIPKLPRTTDARLLRAIPRMEPWPSGSGTNRWALHERGQQCLICLGAGAKAGLDLSEERGVFRAYAVNPRTGELKPRQENIRAGGLLKLPKSEEGMSVVWITKE